MKKRDRKKQYARVRFDSGQHRRILAAALALGLAGFLPVAARLYQLMVTDYEYYADLALRNQTRTTAVTADRGTIYDCNMNILAQSVGVENVYLNPHELNQSRADLELISQRLGQILSLDPQWILEQSKDRTKRYKQVAARISEETAAVIRAFINENGISGTHLEPNSSAIIPMVPWRLR